MSEILDRARKMRAYIEKQSANLTDKEAVEMPDVFPVWDSSETYATGDRVQFEGTVYKCLQLHEAQPTWTPTDAHSLWAEVLAFDDSPREWVQPDSTNAYMTGDRVLFEGKVYESLIDNNVWSPAAYPAGWSEVAA